MKLSKADCSVNFKGGLINLLKSEIASSDVDKNSAYMQKLIFWRQWLVI